MSSADAANVVEHETVSFQGRELTISWPRSPIVGSAEVVEDSCKVKVTGLPHACDEDLLVMFFENKKRSGGGEVKELEMMHSLEEALITFVDSQGRNV